MLGLVRLEHHEVLDAGLKLTADIGVCLDIQCQQQASAGSDGVSIVL